MGDEEAFLPPDPERQTDFVLIRSFYGETRPEQSQELAARYRAASESLQGVEEGFNALRSEEEAARPTPEAVDSLLARYRTLLTEARGSPGFHPRTCRHLEAAPEPDRGGAGTARRPARLRSPRRANGWPPAVRLGRRRARSSERSPPQSRRPKPSSVPTGRSRRVASWTWPPPILQAIDAGLQRLTGAKAALTDLDVQLDTLRQAGFAIDRFASRREDLDVALGATAAALAKPTEKTVAAVSEVVRTVEELVSEAEAWPELQRQNAERVTPPAPAW